MTRQYNYRTRNVRHCSMTFRSLMLLCVSLFTLGQQAIAQKAINPTQVKRELRRDAMQIRFRVSTSHIDPKYMNNKDSLARIVEWINQVQQDSMVEIVNVEFGGAVSPEGSVRFNHYLSNARLSALEKYIRSKIEIPNNIIIRNDRYIAWEQLKEMVYNSDLHNKQEIIEILDSENRSTGEQLDSRINDLKKMDNGITWKKLFNMFFMDMRNAYTVLVTKKSQIAIRYERLQELVVAPQKIIPDPIIATAPMYTLQTLETKHEPAMRYMYVKSNLIGLGLLMANLGVEFDLGDYFSLSLPIYYSAVDYFSHTLKFRTFAVQPELRIWPTKNDDGLFIGAHMGFAYYNFAFNGNWRYQDKNGNTPTLGGGLSLGYRIPISDNSRWKLEMAAGAGIYPLHYNVFHNERNGLVHETRKKTYIGLDNVLLGISYQIPFKKVKPNR